MRSLHFFAITGLLVLVACSDVRKPSDANFTKAIDQYLMNHDEACVVIDRRFPVDVPKSHQNGQYGIEAKLAVLEQAGLLHGTDTTAVVHGMLDALRGSTPPQPVKRYELTAEGRKYFQAIPGTLGQNNGFCYGHKSVGLIVKWTEPAAAGPYSQTVVTYTYRIVDQASWAERPNVQQAFPDIRTTINGASKTTQTAGLQLTNQGWEVPGS